MSTPPMTIDTSANDAPMMYRYQLSRLILGNARSLAPTISGMRKLPSTAGTDGIRKKKTIVIPCMVNSLLYVSDETRSPAGVSSSSRISMAKNPPTKNIPVIEIRYRIAIRLWSFVNSHDFRP